MGPKFLDFVLFGRYIEFLLSISCAAVPFFELIVVRASGNMLTDFLNPYGFGDKLDKR